MSRMRIIKPSFWDDEKIASLPRDARLFYIGIWTYCDDFGVVRANPSWLKSMIFPYDDDMKIENIHLWLQMLIDLNRLKSFTDSKNRENYFYLPKFIEHQKINKPGKTRNPSPPEECLNPGISNGYKKSEKEKTFPENSGNPPENSRKFRSEVGVGVGIGVSNKKNKNKNKKESEKNNFPENKKNNLKNNSEKNKKIPEEKKIDRSIEIYEFYLTEIQPIQKTKSRSIKNISYYLKTHSAEDLIDSIRNYNVIAKIRDPTYRKDPANFFGKSEPAFVDFLPGAFVMPMPVKRAPPRYQNQSDRNWEACQQFLEEG